MTMKQPLKLGVGVKESKSSVLGANYTLKQPEYNPSKVSERGNFKDFSGGAGSNVFKINKDGVFCGGNNYDDAPFQLSYEAMMRLGGTTGPGIGLDGDGGTLDLYYDNSITGYIDGYTTEGSETSYIRIIADSGRSLKLKNSYVECDGNFLPASDEGSSLGTGALSWNDVYAKSIIASGSGAKFSINGSDGTTDDLNDSTGTKIATIIGGIITQTDY